MGTRELLILILGLAVIAVILRGLYVAIQARRRQIRLAIDKNIPQDIDLEELELSELPSGGARVIKRSRGAAELSDSMQKELDLSAEADADEAVPMLLESVEIKQGTAGAERDGDRNSAADVGAQPERPGLEAILSAQSEGDSSEAVEAEPGAEQHGNRTEDSRGDDHLFHGETDQGDEFDNGVDSELDPDMEEETSAVDERDRSSAQSWEDDDDFGGFSMSAGERIGGSEDAPSGADRPAGSARKSSLLSRFGKKTNDMEGDFDGYRSDADHKSGYDAAPDEAPVTAASSPAPEARSQREDDSEPAQVDPVPSRSESGAVTDFSQARESRRPASSREPSQSSQSRRDFEPSEVLVINVMARDGELLRGKDLFRVLVTAGLQHGDMNIFHRRLKDDSSAPVVYSVANILNPGTFDLNDMDSFTTPGVSLFLAMPAVISNREAFEDMLRTAQQIRAGMDAELRDDHRSVMTAQTVEHYRQRIQDYELRKLKAAHAHS